MYYSISYKQKGTWVKPTKMYKKNSSRLWKSGDVWYKDNGIWHRLFFFERQFQFPETSGDFISTGEDEHDQFLSEEDGDPVILTFDNFTVQSGHTVTTSKRCKGLYLNILGDLTIDGTLSMTARGAKAEGRYVVVSPNNSIYYCKNDPGEIDCLAKIGAVGGISEGDPTYYSGGYIGSRDGGVGVNGACGGRRQYIF